MFSPSSRPRPTSGRTASPTGPALLLFGLLVLVYPLSIGIRGSRSAEVTGDEPFYLLTTQSLVRDGDLDLLDQYAGRSYREFFDHPDGLWRQSVPNQDGRLLSPHDPGLSVGLIPGYAAGGLRGAQVELVVALAVAFALAYVLAVRLLGRSPAVWWSCLAVGATAPAVVYATEVYPEGPAALALVVSLLPLARPERPGPGGAAMGLVALSALGWLGVKFVPLVAVLSVVYLIRGTRSARALMVVLGVVSAATFVWFRFSRFGAITPYGLNSAFAGQTTGQLLETHISGWDRVYRLWGLIIDRRFGLGRWAPVVLLALPGLVLLWRRPRARPVVLLVTAQVLIATFLAITMMGWWFPGRTLVAILPLLAVGLAAVVVGGGPRVRAAAWILGAYTAAVTGALLAAGRAGEVTTAVDPFALSSPVFTVPALLFPQYTRWGPDTWLLTVGWLAAALAAAWWLAWGRASLRAGSRLGEGPEGLGRPDATGGADDGHRDVVR